MLADASGSPSPGARSAVRGAVGAGPAPAALPRPIVGVVFAWSGILSTEGSERRVRRSRRVHLCVDIQCCLIVPELERDKLVGIEGALKDLEC